MKAKRRIHKFNFDEPTMKSGAKTHVALVDSAANLTEVLVMKSKSTHVEQTTEVTEYDHETGTSEYARDSLSMDDYGGEFVHVTDRKVRVTDYRIKVR